jgi:hypothetical protein
MEATPRIHLGLPTSQIGSPRKGSPLLAVSIPHAAYRANALTSIEDLLQQPALRPTILAYQDLASKLLGLDLEPIRPLLARTYAATGRPGREPCTLFRCLLLMNWCGFTEFEPWIAEMRAHPLWPILCGIQPADVPGASTLRDLLRRLTRTWRKRPKQRRRRRSAQKRSAARKGQKLPERHPNVVARLLAWLPHRPVQEDTLNEILACLARTSAARGLIDQQNLHVAGDGTPITSHTDGRGKRRCKCPPGTDCTCRRLFTDPDAAWGWDSHNECWFWGYHLYELTAAGCAHDLPLYLQRASANRNDAVAFVPAYLGLRRLYADWHLSAMLLDAGHDCEPLYALLHGDRVRPIIDLNTHGKDSAAFADPLHPPMNRAGTPICAAGHLMAPNGTSRGRGVWSCPALRVRTGIQCDLPCKKKRVYTTAASFVRAFPGLLRGSQPWKDLYAERTAVERSHKRKLRDFRHEFGRTRRAAYRLGLYFFAAYCQHVDAWFAQAPCIDHALREVIAASRVA